MVTVQGPHGDWVGLTFKADIEEAIVNNNKEKFKQSFHTPFL
jgi:hypothetical protein